MKAKVLLLFSILLLSCSEQDAEPELGSKETEFEKKKAETLDKLRNAEQAYDYILAYADSRGTYWELERHRRMLWENYLDARWFWIVDDTVNSPFYYGRLAGIDSVKQNRMYMRSWMEVDYEPGCKFVVPQADGDTVTVLRIANLDYILVRLANVTRETKLGNTAVECLSKKEAWNIIYTSTGLVSYGYLRRCPVFGELRDKCYKEDFNIDEYLGRYR